MSAECTRNLTVIARNATDGLYYTGFITSNITGNEEYHHIKFHNIQPQDVPVNHVITIGGAVPWPELHRGDYVLVRDSCKSNGIECYLPARVKCLPIDFRHENRFFVVQLYTGIKKTKFRRHIIKIGKQKYYEILEYMNTLRHHCPIKFASEPDLRSGKRLLRKLLRKNTLWDAFGLPIRTHHQRHRYYESPRKSRMSYKRSVSSYTVKRRPRKASADTGSVRSSRSTTTIATIRSDSSRTSRGNRVSRDRVAKHNLKSTHLKLGDDVLARWQDDGWYYFGRVVKHGKEGTIQVLDSTGYEEWIRKDDILVSDETEEILLHDKVVALHPRYVYSYAPATVFGVSHENKFEEAKTDYGYRVIFYDGSERRLPRSEIYKISHQKFTEDVQYIKCQEISLCGEVVARDDTSGLYKRYMAESPDHSMQRLFLQLPNNSFKKQSVIHIFPFDILNQNRNRNWKCVLAPVDPACTVYLPAKIISKEPFHLLFCNGERNNSTTELRQCFHISEEYYRNAVHYFYSNNTQSSMSFKRRQ